MSKQFRRFVRLKELKSLVGLCRTTIYQKVKAGDFPKPYSIGLRAVGWDSAEIAEWMNTRIKTN